MATVGATNPTLQDLASRMQDKKIAAIIEMLKQTNEILDDMTWIEANDGTNHQTTVRSGLPTVAWRLLGYGVPPSKSRTVKVKDTCGMLEGYSEIDKSLADLNGNTAAFRLSEDVGFLQAINNQMATALIYGNQATDPEQITGLAPRFSSLTAENGANIISGGAAAGQTDCTSVWFCIWSPNILHGIYPKGSNAGVQHKDLGEVTLDDSNTPTGHYQGYRAHYKWDCGLSLRDWRGVSRIANIDVSELADAGETAFDGANLPNLFIKAYNKIRKVLKTGRPAIYCNETVMTAVDLIASAKSNTWFTKADGIDGNAIVKFRGIPIRQVDAILNTESVVA